MQKFIENTFAIFLMIVILTLVLILTVGAGFLVASGSILFILVGSILLLGLLPAWIEGARILQSLVTTKDL